MEWLPARLARRADAIVADRTGPAVVGTAAAILVRLAQPVAAHADTAVARAGGTGLAFRAQAIAAHRAHPAVRRTAGAALARIAQPVAAGAASAVVGAGATILRRLAQAVSASADAAIGRAVDTALRPRAGAVPAPRLEQARRRAPVAARRVGVIAALSGLEDPVAASERTAAAVLGACRARLRGVADVVAARRLGRPTPGRNAGGEDRHDQRRPEHRHPKPARDHESS